MSEWSAGGTTDVNLEGLLLGDLLGSVDLINCVANEWTELSFWDGGVFGITLWALEGILPGISYRIEIRFPVMSNDGITVGS